MANTFGTLPTAVGTGVYKHDFEARLQTRLSKPVTFKDVCDVRYTNSMAINFPYMSTEFVAQTGTRGTAYGFSDFTLTNDSLTLNVPKMVPVFIDRADLAQCSYADQMDIADRQGRLLLDQVETTVLADHAAWTNVGDSAGAIASGVTSPITVSATNIDDVVRGIRRIVAVANGTDLMNQYGLFFVWRPADFEALEQFAQANGYNLADAALKNGIERGYYLLGAYHYVSNSHASGGHVFAGVRKQHKVGICTATWGKVVETVDPALQSGVGLIARADFGVKTPAGLSTILYDINVA